MVLPHAAALGPVCPPPLHTPTLGGQTRLLWCGQVSVNEGRQELVVPRG